MSFLDVSAPLPSRFKAWIDERFPLANAPAFFLFYLTAAFIADHDRGGGVRLGWSDLASCLAVWCMFLLLRVFDEHKDYEDDIVHHSGRVLQRGLITLGHLKAVGALCFAITGLWSIARGGFGPPFIAWAVMIGWALLMAAEFFCPEWLKKRLVIYAISHMAIMPLVAVWCVTLKTPAVVMTVNLLLLALLFFLTAVAFEIGRKTRGPEEERDGVDGYSKVFGTIGSAVVLCVITASILLVIFWLAWRVQTPPAALYLLAPAAIGGVLALVMIAGFIGSPSAKARKKNEAALGLFALLGYGSIIASIAFSDGVIFR